MCRMSVLVDLANVKCPFDFCAEVMEARDFEAHAQDYEKHATMFRSVAQLQPQRQQHQGDFPLAEHVHLENDLLKFLRFGDEASAEEKLLKHPSLVTTLLGYTMSALTVARFAASVHTDEDELPSPSLFQKEKTLLMHASETGDHNLVCALLDIDDSPKYIRRQRKDNGMSALHYASSSVWHKIVEELLNAERYPKHLLRQYHRHHSSNNALMFASKRAHLEVVRVLLKAIAGSVEILGQQEALSGRNADKVTLKW